MGIRDYCDADSSLPAYGREPFGHPTYFDRYGLGRPKAELRSLVMSMSACASEMLKTSAIAKASYPSLKS